MFGLGKKDSTKSQDSSRDSQDPRRGKFELLKATVKTLYNLRSRSNKKKNIDKLQKDLLKIKDIVDNLTRLIDTLRIQEINAKDNNELQNFTIQLSDVIGIVAKSLVIFNNPDSGPQQKLDLFEQTLSHVSALLDAFDKLDLGELLGNIPKWIDELQSKLLGAIDNQEGKTGPDIIEKIDSYLLSSSEENLEDFKALSPIQQDAILVGFQKLNHAIREVVIFADKFEIEYLLKEGSILDQIEFNGRDLNDRIRAFGKAYNERLIAAGYSKDEIYPFARSKYKSRNQLLIQTQKHLDDELNLIKVENQRLLNEIETKLKINIADPKTKKKEKEKFELELTNLHSNYKPITKSPRSEKLKKTLERIKVLTDENTTQLLTNSTDSIYHTTGKELQDELIKLATSLADNIQAFFHDSKEGLKNIKKRNALSDINDAMEAIENELREAVDPFIFKQYFEGDDLSSTQGSPINSWIHDLGYAFKSAKKAVSALNELSKSFQSYKNKDRLHSSPNETPESNLIKHIQLINQFREYVADDMLLKAAKPLLSNPFIRESRHALKRLTGENPFEYELMDPLIELTKLTCSNIFEKLQGGEKLTALTSQFENIYIYTSANYAIDKKTHTKTIASLRKLSALTKDVDGVLKTNDINFFNIISFVFSNAKIVFELINELSQSKTLLSQLVKEQALQLIQIFNQLIMRLFLLVDEFELKFYLKSGYLAQKIKVPVNGTEHSLFELFNQFYKKIDDKGFDFSEKERFPFQSAILEQRESLLSAKKTLQIPEADFTELYAERDRVHDNIFNNADHAKIALKKSIDTLEENYNLLKIICIQHLHEAWDRIKTNPDHTAILLDYVENCYDEVLDRHSTRSNADNELISKMRKLVKFIRTERDSKDILTLLTEIEKNTLTLPLTRSAKPIRYLQRSIESYKVTLTDIENYKKTIACADALDLLLHSENTHHFAKHRRYVESHSLEFRAIYHKLSKLKGRQKNIINEVNFISQKVDEAKTNKVEPHNIKFNNTPPDLIDIKLSQLKYQRHKTILFFANKTRLDLENNIIKLTSLKDGILHIKKNKPNITHSDVLRLIDNRLRELEAENGALFNLSKIKTEKIKLLTEFKIHLRNNTYQQAILKIRDSNSKTFHLLFEGRTGKLLNQTELSTLTRPQMLRQIDVEIARLKLKDVKSSFFFATRKQNNIDARINALEALKSDTCTPEQIKLLEAKEAFLLTNFQTWRANNAITHP